MACVACGAACASEPPLGDTDGGGASDGGGSDGRAPMDAMAPDAGGMDAAAADGGAGEPDGALWVDPGPFGPEVRLVYLVPTDRVARPEYVRGIERAARHLQRFYRDQIGTGVTFRLHDPVVEIVTTGHAADFYASTTRPGEGMSNWWWGNVTEEGFALTGGGFDDPDNIWIYYNDSDTACGQTGGAGTSGVAAMPANDLRGLAGIVGVPACPDDPMWWYEYPPCRWIGGLGHELGHAFGLPHPPGCDSGASSCDMGALMWTGVYSYPDAYLRDDETSVLVRLPFFAMRDAVPFFACDTP